MKLVSKLLDVVREQYQRLMITYSQRELVGLEGILINDCNEYLLRTQHVFACCRSQHRSLMFVAGTVEETMNIVMDIFKWRYM